MPYLKGWATRGDGNLAHVRRHSAADCSTEHTQFCFSTGGLFCGVNPSVLEKVNKLAEGIVVSDESMKALKHYRPRRLMRIFKMWREFYNVIWLGTETQYPALRSRRQYKRYSLRNHFRVWKFIGIIRKQNEQPPAEIGDASPIPANRIGESRYYAAHHFAKTCYYCGERRHDGIDEPLRRLNNFKYCCEPCWKEKHC